MNNKLQLKHLLIFFVITIIVAFAVYFFAADDNTQTRESVIDTKIKIATTIYPLYDIARNVAGDTVEAQFILPPGASPHFYEFSPSQLAKLQGTKVIFAIGHGLDDWAHKIEEAIPGTRVVLVDKDIVLRKPEEVRKDKKQHEHGHGHGSEDPHYWLHFGNAEQIARNVLETLEGLDPANKVIYQENTEGYARMLQQKEIELKEKLKGIINYKIITLHDAWFYFADNFNLEIVGTFEPSAGREPTPRYLAGLRREIKKTKTKVLFGETQRGISILENFAKDNNLSLVILDPLGGTENKETFIKLMEYNINAIVNEFQNIPID